MACLFIILDPEEDLVDWNLGGLPWASFPRTLWAQFDRNNRNNMLTYIWVTNMTWYNRIVILLYAICSYLLYHIIYIYRINQPTFHASSPTTPPRHMDWVFSMCFFEGWALVELKYWQWVCPGGLSTYHAGWTWIDWKWCTATPRKLYKSYMDVQQHLMHVNITYWLYGIHFWTIVFNNSMEIFSFTKIDWNLSCFAFILYQVTKNHQGHSLVLWKTHDKSLDTSWHLDKIKSNTLIRLVGKGSGFGFLYF